MNNFVLINNSLFHFSLSYLEQIMYDFSRKVAKNLLSLIVQFRAV